MDLQTTIVGLLVATLCIYVFVLLNKSRKNKEKILINQLQVLASEQNALIEDHELGLNFGLGIDEVNRYIFYTKDNKIGFTNKTIDLMNVRKCEVATVKKRVGKEDYIDRISLVFYLISNNKEEQIIIFDSDATALPNGEPLMAKKWADRINELLKDVKSNAAFRVAV
ncbi:MAG: hypothetical protein JJ978_09965 [Roseivirga sp.]|jgi:hypothetical protein|uniref:hypothetical protein n=1 Tax=Roseivirga sp. TaxID=1964215 RepID=UPI001B079F8B|nr:hypothetical protein [Roseivirga sp.]MBO6495880.1 hypothetical protein [Roseivirga sp.]